MAKDEGSVGAKIVVEVTSDTPTYYSNHMDFVGNRHEIVMSVARLPAKPTPDLIEEVEKTGQIVIDAELAILIPPTMLDGLITALETTKKNYEDQYGPIRELKQ